MMATDGFSLIAMAGLLQQSHRPSTRINSRLVEGDDGESDRPPLSEPHMSRRTRLRIQFAVAASALVLAPTGAIFHRVLLGGEWLGARDSIRVVLPLTKYFKERVSRGEFPEWYPYDGLGQPFVAMMLSAVFHPLRLLDLLLPIPLSLSASALMAYPLAAFGTYLCARRALGMGRHGALFAAISYAFCGYLVGISNTLPYLVSAATFPLSVWASCRFARTPTPAVLLVAAAMSASVLFIGDVLGFASCVFAALLVAALVPTDRPWRHRAVIGLAMIGASAALSAPQLLPSLSLIGERETMLVPAVAQRFSFYPLRTLEMAWGPLFISPKAGFVPQRVSMLIEPMGRSLWTDSAALGSIAFGLMVAAAITLARRRTPRLLGAVALLLWLLAFGRYTPLYEWFFRLVPLWKAFRYPEKLLPYALFIAALGAGWSLHAARRDVHFRHLAARVLLVVAGTSLVGGTLQVTFGAWSKLLEAIGVAHEETRTQLSSHFVQLLLVSAMMSGAAALMLARMASRRAAWALCAAQTCALVWMHAPIPQTVDLPLLKEPTPLVQELILRGATVGTSRVESAARSHRVPMLSHLTSREKLAAGSFALIAADTQALFNIETSSSYLPAGSLRVAQLQERPQQWSDSLSARLGTRFQVVEEQAASELEKDARYRMAARLPDWGLLLVERVDALPRVYVARARCVTDKAAAIEAMRSTSGPASEAIVECGQATLGSGDGAGQGKAELVSYAPEEVVVRATTSQSAVLVLNDAFYPGWRAEVDGVAAPILAANVAVRAVSLGPGDHTVVFRYRQPGLRPGLLIAAAVLLAFVSAIFIQRLAARRRSSASPQRAARSKAKRKRLDEWASSR